MLVLRSIGENDKANEMMAKFNQSSEMIAEILFKTEIILRNKKKIQQIEVRMRNQFSVLRLRNSDLFR
jgi:flagellar motor protein MotB